MSNQSQHPVKSIIITFNGNKTYATQLTAYAGEVRVRSAEAKCNPDDPFVAYEGARIALARLYGVDPFPVDPEPKFEVGDLVRLNVTDTRRGMGEGSLCVVVDKAPNKMTPYVVRVLDDPENLNAPKYDVIVMPGEMSKIEEVKA